MTKAFVHAKKGRLTYGLAVRNPDTYPEGEYRVFFYQSEKTRDRAAERDREYMPEVVPFEIDIAKLADLP